MRRLALVLTSLAVLAVAAATIAPAATRDTTLSLVAYSTPKEAFTQIIPAFQQTAAGKGVSVQQSYGASGDQAHAVIAGLPADVVDLSLEPDVTSLVNAGLVAKDWKNNAYKGIVTRSVVVFVVRNGNPKHIKNWSDLVKPGIEVLTPNPFTSGGARWNVMAAYGAQLRNKKTPAQAVKYLDTLFHHVVVQDKSAREALQTFLGGKGDVLLTYENEAKLALAKGQAAYYVIPKATIRIDNPLAVLKTSKNPTQAKAFAKFLYTPTAQRIFAKTGYRPVNRSIIKEFSFPVRPWMFTIDYLGGWAKVEKKFFDPNNSVMAKIERGLGS
jgi:sulfate transport system substrate-binding protein